MEITLIAALTKDRVIGSALGGIPWSLPRDKEHFRNYCAGKAMLIGRRTFEEMSGWFTDQTPIVLTRQADYAAHSGAYVVSSVENAITLAENLQSKELVVAGGAAIYEAAISEANKLLLTWIEVPPDFEVDHPVYFPPLTENTWISKQTEHWPSNTNNKYPMTLEILEKDAQ